GRRVAHRHRRARPARARGPALRETDPEDREPMNTETRRVAVVGAHRIPFARANSTYAHASNQDMLTVVLDGLADRCSLHGERLREGGGGAGAHPRRDSALNRA